MGWRRLPALLLTVAALAADDLPPVGRIIVFGDLHLASAVRALLPSPPVTFTDSSGEKLRQTIAASALWKRSDVTWVCCEPGSSAILYVGVKHSADGPPMRPAPTGAARLQADDLALYQQWMDLNHQTVTRGGSPGAMQSLEGTASSRSAKRSAHWRDVALHASDRLHRAAAIHLAAYGPKDETLAGVLAQAVSDPDSLVRNNAVRAIGVLAMTESGRRLVRRHPGPLIDLFSSAHWTDWNKASFALAPVTESADTAFLRELQRACEPLRQIAGWAPMHATAAQLIFDRMKAAGAESCG